MKFHLLYLLIFLWFACSANVFNQDLNLCSAYLHNDTLTMENEYIIQHFRWNDGNLIRLSLSEKSSNELLIKSDVKPAFSLENNSSVIRGKGFLKIAKQPADPITPAYLRVEVNSSVGKLNIKQVFRIYSQCPAIACEIYLKGEMESPSVAENNNNEVKNQEEIQVQVMDKLKLQGNHWHASSIEFFDVTDRTNTLVQTYDYLLYSLEYKVRGNILFLENLLTGSRLFLLKEAPTSIKQLNYPGYDFLIKLNEVKIAGLGINSSDLKDSAWTRAYGTVIGIALTNDELGVLSSLRQYQQNVRIHNPERDEMILMNTWGDQNRDSRLSEAFAISELEAGAKLGITHFQLDDGWQTGWAGDPASDNQLSDNFWSKQNFWKPNPEKFPNGLSPVVKKGEELGIEICLWFFPASEKSYMNWEKDANVLISLYREFNIRTFKIDGVSIRNKTSEINFRNMLDKVVDASNGEVVFNLDVTAGQRGGYHFFNEYGNIFLENRYTGSHNYYPYRTLRNLWMLSRYVPPQNLQIEFLNIWRNKEKYADDFFGPANYTFDYVFAITMMAQPLAWFEATGLPEEAFQTSPLIKKYRSIQSELHSGMIFPIGNEPDGKSWTGFQSIINDEGFLLVYREDNDNSKTMLKTWLKPGTKITCKPILGGGKPFMALVDNEGRLPFELTLKNSFVLYSYSVKE